MEQVDDIVVVVPDHCQRCRQPFLATESRRHDRPWRHQVVEVLPLTVQVTEYQMDFLVATGEAALRGSPPPFLLLALQGN